jgi:DNA polymerase-3 subunit gamma/tau
MIRQTHTYLAGALSGTALIVAAVVAFVLLVSLQALRDWPLAGIGGAGDNVGVSAGRPAAAGIAPGAHAGTATAARHGAPAVSHGGGRNRAGATEGQRGHVAVGTSPSSSAEAPGSSPAAGGGSPGSSPATGSNPGAGSGSGNGGGSGPQASGGPGTSTSGAVNGAVSGVDQATGGALGETGVTKVTEGAVKGVAGPESPVGKTVDKAGEAVGGLLPGNR